MKNAVFFRGKNCWTRFWAQYTGTGLGGRLAARFATWFVPPYYSRCFLAELNPKGFISPRATIYHDDLVIGKNVFIGDGVVIYKHINGGRVDLGDRVHLYGDTYVQTGKEGRVLIGRNTHIQPRCQLSGYKASIIIGENVQIAPACAFYPYDHGILPGELILNQDLATKGDIEISDDVWLGFGVIVLGGVKIGKGAVVGAGSVVTHDIPEGAIAAGNPARILGERGTLQKNKRNI